MRSINAIIVGVVFGILTMVVQRVIKKGPLGPGEVIASLLLGWAIYYAMTLNNCLVMVIAIIVVILYAHTARECYNRGSTVGASLSMAMALAALVFSFFLKDRVVANSEVSTIVIEYFWILALVAFLCALAKNPGWLRTLAFVLAVAFLVTCVPWGSIIPGGQPTVGVEDKENLTIDIDSEQYEEYFISKYKDVAWTFLENSYSKMDAERVEATGLSDAVTFPFTSKKPKEQKEELKKEILQNPLLGVAYAEMLSLIPLDDNETLGTKNPWLTEMVNLHKQYGRTVWQEYDPDTDGFLVNKQYRKRAVAICDIIDRMIVIGDKKMTTVVMWPLPIASEEPIDTLRMAIRNDKPESQYTRSSLVFGYRPKGSLGYAFIFGANLDDKRPEFFADKEEAKQEASEPSPETTSPPDRTPKNPIQDAVNKDQAPVGGGDNKPADGAGDLQKDDPREEEASTGGSNGGNGGGYTPPQFVKPEAPPVTEEYEDEKVVTSSSPMSYEEDEVTDNGATDGTDPTVIPGEEFDPGS